MNFVIAYSSKYLGLNMGIDAHNDPFKFVIQGYIQAAYVVRSMGLGILSSLRVCNSQAFSNWLTHYNSMTPTAEFWLLRLVLSNCCLLRPPIVLNVLLFRILNS
jgi:hypothetical protein